MKGKCLIYWVFVAVILHNSLCFATITELNAIVEKDGTFFGTSGEGGAEAQPVGRYPVGSIPVVVNSIDMGFPIEPSTTYSFSLATPMPAVSAGSLTITETNGDFNNAGETVTVRFDGLNLGTFTFATDNANCTRTLDMTLTIDSEELVGAAADGEILVDLTTSSGVDQSVGTPYHSAQGTSWMNVTLEYNGIPEPATVLLLALGGLGLTRRRRV